MTLYDPNNKPATFGSSSSLHNECSIGLSANVREATTMEKCRDLANDNMHTINEISSRITLLLERLRGPACSGCGVTGDKEDIPGGMLNIHLDQLGYESRRLGEIQADLSVLEQLL